MGLAQSTATADSAERERAEIGRSFSARTIKGYWGFSTSFSMLLPPLLPEAMPGTGLGRLYFDGNGGCSVTLWANVNGETNPSRSSTCRYAVNSDGTGSSEAVFEGLPLQGPISIVFVIVDDGREIRAMNDKSIVSTFTARRQ